MILMFVGVVRLVIWMVGVIVMVFVVVLVGFELSGR